MYRIENKEAAVREVQTYLLEISHATEGLAHIAIDGMYGEETRAAVAAYQNRYNLPETGTVDYATWESLRSAYEDARKERTANPTLLPTGVLPLSVGARGSAVYLAQVLIAALCDRYARLPCIPITGYYDRGMAEAVRVFQGYHRLPQSGILDDDTWQALCADYKQNGQETP